MANESSFDGCVTFYHRNLEDTSDGRSKLAELIVDFGKIYRGYYGFINLLDEPEIDEGFDYAQSEELCCSSVGRWSFENSFHWCLTLNQNELNNAIKEHGTTSTLQDFIGFGLTIYGRDFEPGCEYLADFNGQIEITGLEEKDGVLQTVTEVIESNEEVLEYNSSNVNAFEDEVMYFDFYTYYGISVLIHDVYQTEDREWDLFKKYMPIFTSIYKEEMDKIRLNFNHLHTDKLNKILNIALNHFSKLNTDSIYLLDEFRLEEFENNKVVHYEYLNRDFASIFKGIEADIKKVFK